MSGRIALLGALLLIGCGGRSCGASSPTLTSAEFEAAYCRGGTRPPYLDPQLAADVHTEAAVAEVAERPMLLGLRMDAEVIGCRPAEELFDSFAFTPPDRRCPRLAEGVDEVQASCRTKAGRIITLLQIAAERTP